MFDTLTSGNVHDFNQRYRGTFGFLITEEKQTLVQINQITEQKVHFSTQDEEQWWALADKNVLFKFLPLNRGFCNTQNGLYFVARVPARMWQRGISHQNTSIMSFKPRLNWFSEPPSFENLSAIFEKQTAPDRTFSTPTALSSAFAIIRGSVYLFSEKIGTATSKIITLKKTAAIVEQELNDTIRRNNFNLQTVVEK